jgi:o-succinylbenzoate synthase
MIPLEVRAELCGRPRAHVVVRAVDPDGRVGIGEASPLAPFSREDAVGCHRALLEASGHLGGIEDAGAPAEVVALALARCCLDDVPAARFAIETALFDLVGQRRGESVATCLRGSSASTTTIPVNALLSIEDPDVADRASELAAAGFVALKIKLRARDEAGFARELSLLREVRARLPLPYDLRLDPNGAWSLDEARTRLQALAPIAPRYVEQPVADHLLPELGECALPWAADESLARPALVEALLASRGCAAFILKPAFLGGLARARDLAVRAAARGIDAVVTHAFDGPFAMAAACELALSLPRAPLPSGLAAHRDLAAFLEEHRVFVPHLARRIEVVPSGKPGLGVQTRAR